MKSYKLVYFDLKSRGEIVRAIFEVAGVSYDDSRFPYDRNMKDLQSIQEFREKWQPSSVKAEAPFGQLPYLQVTHEDGRVTVISQSMAISRYLAREFGLAGKDNEEQALVDMFNDQIQDFANQLYRVIYEFDETRKKSQLEQVRNSVIPDNFAIFEKHLAKNGTGYLVGRDLTWADLDLFIYLDFLAENKSLFESLFASGKYAHVKAFHERLEADSRLATYLEKNRKRPFGSMIYDTFCEQLAALPAPK